MVKTRIEQGATIDILGVTHAFDTPNGPLQVLDGVNISAKAGEFIALVGPSGCGKSTLLRLLAGLDKALFGDVFIGGRKVTGPDPRHGLVFQDPTLLPWRTVRQNVALGPEARGLAQTLAEEIDATIRLVNLEEFVDSLPAQLSGGMQQRAALARVLVNDPELMLLDEPLGKLDALTRRTLQKEILRLWRDRGFTALLVTHDVDEALLLANRIVVFSHRPARVLAQIEVDQSYPRDPDSTEFIRLRAEVLALLDAQDLPVQALDVGVGA